MHSQHTESEGYDRSSLELPGMQETFVRLLARLTTTPLIVVLVHGAPSRATRPHVTLMQMRKSSCPGIECSAGDHRGTAPW